MVVEIRRGSARFTERVPARLTRHAFSFGPHYDPERLSWGAMVCHDDHLLGRGQGFDRHRHTDLVIVTTVLDGALRHSGSDGLGGEHVLQAGDVAVLHTGTGDGVEHAEHATEDGPCRFVQVWLRPEGDVQTPRYDVVRQARGQVLVSHEPDMGPGVVIDLPVGSYRVVRLEAGETYTLSGSPRSHVFVASGALLRFSLAEPLEAGDALLVDYVDDDDYEVTAAVPTLLLDWDFV